MEIDSGTLGRSARGKVPLFGPSGEVIGAVSVGIAYDSVRARLLAAIPLLAYAGGALAVGALAAYLISRRLQRQTHDLAFSDISALLTEREAMLHGIREGVVALDGAGRVRLLNDEAQRLLGLGPEAAGRPLEEVLGDGRTTDVLAGRVVGDDLLAVRGSRVLLANRMPTDDGGAVVTLRDRTELEHLGRELDSTTGLIDALRAQDHEHANRLHTLLGLLELEMHEDAMEFVTEVVGVHRATAEQVTEKVQDPLLAALLVGKTTVAAERGVSLRLAPGTLLPDRVVDPRGLVTVVGNLVDNATDAAAGSDGARIEVGLRTEGRTVVLEVRDSGPGVPQDQHASIFTEGWSTKRRPGARQTRARARPRKTARGAPGRQCDGVRGGRRRRGVHGRPSGGAGGARRGIPGRCAAPHASGDDGRAAVIEVLIVDDDVRVAQINAAYVAKVPGFRVAAQAHSAAGALARVEEVPVDLILLDHYLPDRNGLAVVRELRRLGRQVDVVMVTAARDVATVQDAMRHGALQYLVKPFTYAGLRAKLEAYAALRQTLDGGGEAEQAEVDRLFGALWATGEPALPKGHSPPRPSSSGGPARRGRPAVRAGDRRQRGDEPADRPALSETPRAHRQGAADPAVRGDGPPGTPVRLGRGLSPRPARPMPPRPPSAPAPRPRRAWPRRAAPAR